jgi:hypothetical protein
VDVDLTVRTRVVARQERSSIPVIMISILLYAKVIEGFEITFEVVFRHVRPSIPYNRMLILIEDGYRTRFIRKIFWKRYTMEILRNIEFRFDVSENFVQRSKVRPVVVVTYMVW